MLNFIECFERVLIKIISDLIPDSSPKFCLICMDESEQNDSFQKPTKISLQLTIISSRFANFWNFSLS
jgi:hypothetical protein